MAVKWLREKCLFLPDYRPFGRRGVRQDAVSAHSRAPAIFGLGLGLVLPLGQYGRPS